MTLPDKKNFLIFLMLITLQPPGVQAGELPAVENILQKDFPVKTEDLEKVANDLFVEYERKNNVSSLIFYSYGMLRLAKNYEKHNLFIKASEYSKIGFFYLDEVTDSHESDWRVLYMRARVDAYLPASLGRCVVASRDTEQLLERPESYTSEIAAHINYMRFRALRSCNENENADLLLTMMKKGNQVEKKLMSLGMDSVPAWDYEEITQVITPLMSGE